MPRTLFASIIVALSVLATMAQPARLSMLQPAAFEPPANAAGSITLYPVADAWINYNLPDNNYGAGVSLKVGSEECPGQEFPDRGRALIRFDLSAIPAGQVIESASLHLYLRYVYDSGAAVNTITVHRVTAIWTETGVTWNDQPYHSGTIWAATDVGLTPGVWYSWDITELVREWYSGAYPNYGLKLISADETMCNMRYFDSRENLYDPRLVITYGARYGFIYLPLVLKTP